MRLTESLLSSYAWSVYRAIVPYRVRRFFFRRAVRRV